MNGASVLIVDDEPQMLSIISFAVQTHGFVPTTARSAEEAWALLRREQFDLVVLDVMLPGSSGLDLCQRLRAESDVPIIMLTARTHEDDRVAGLVAGADDYVTKPFSPRELVLRAEAVLRRTRAPEPGEDVITNGPLRIDLRRQEVQVDGRLVHLTDVELRLLAALARRAGQVVTLADLLNLVWFTGEHAGGREMVKTTVYRLRRHLGGDQGWITTVRGVGYLMPLLDEW